MTEKQQKAIELHGKGYNCFQSVACVFAPELDVDEVTAFRMGEGFGLGMGDMSQTCGAITGAVACMGLLPLPPGVFAAMRHIIYCDFEKLFQFKLGEENLPVLAHAVEQYLLCQVERILPALNFYKTICI